MNRELVFTKEIVEKLDTFVDDIAHMERYLLELHPYKRNTTNSDFIDKVTYKVEYFRRGLRKLINNYKDNKN